MSACGCGCDSPAKPGNRYIHGHFTRVVNPQTLRLSRKNNTPPEHRAYLSARGKLLNLGKVGPEHPAWRGGSSDWRGPAPEWKAAKKECRERAGNRCEFTTSGVRCRKVSGLIVHHKVAPEDGVNWDNSQENLKLLCRSHHMVEHNGNHPRAPGG